MAKLPDFEGLAMFAKVAEEGSFAAAARAMGVSVATVSRGVARLEDRLGARLFNRTSRQLSLTEFGRTICEKASEIYRQAEEAESAAREMSVQPRGLVRLAVPMSFGLRWVAPLLPDFFRAYPEVSIDLHLSDAPVDLVADGFDAALRIAALPDSSLVARRLCAVTQFVVASPDYLRREGRPAHPRELVDRPCLSYAYRARSEVWRFTNDAGEEEPVMPTGPLRVTNSDALLPTLLDGLAIAELPEFIAGEYLADGRLEAILTDWSLTRGGLYFVTPSARARPAKVAALSDYFAEHLSDPTWRWPK
ncbi:LysR family transcriptional regulator [Paraburkholderia caribensis]|jgi:DNA-binding transcriptional LysR family regulator|uniref:LysR family transcriptional regulator n=1 Tax=Paraburkholderia caribensis TaxID=75105 RepID=A0A9Q6S4W4_9BURK|nr:LysR family transcriptional regulator [Paraburkholderia caribensis]ALP66121.1 LysR family transcriptional regulator [Paraburkholderia caribensis]AMV45875.1 LysR family transcriptional regulator [Paraburkholderia caribensis]AUT54949.1 LysR family transcriptional regulator [Paraburkholderia caribensis]MCO4877329.1 LysR family transcriptional regulator [Paraburkholderia caribensis]PTB28894.1 LysR family transcriptional regulator [Paraburkholderia caribensis]